MWIDSKETIGGEGEIPNIIASRLAGMSSVQEAFETIQMALSNGRIQRAQRLISSITAVDPGHPDIRRYQQALELARRNRDNARAEYVSACEVYLPRLLY